MAGSDSIRQTKLVVDVVNFTHPLDAAQLAQLAAIAEVEVARVVDVPALVWQEKALEEQVSALVDTLPYTARDWQTKTILINLPGLAPLAAVVLADLHGRMGHFPAILRLRPETERLVTTYVVAEVIDLQTVRDKARTR